MSAQERPKDDYNQQATPPRLGKPMKYHHWYKRNSANTDHDAMAELAERPKAQTAPVHLTDLLRDLWQAKTYILLGALTGIVCAILFTAIATPYFKAGIILSPAKPMSGSNFASAGNADNLSLISYLLQRTGVGNSVEFSQFETMAKGPVIAAQLLNDKNIRTGLYHDRTFPFSTPKESWNAQELSEYLQDRLHMESIGATGMRRMVYSHPDPAFAAYMLQNIQHITDTAIRTATRKETQDRITYLRSNLAQTNNPEHRRALTSLLLEQERLKMLVSIDQPYAAQIIEPASPSAKTTWPDKPLLFATLILAFGFIGFVIFNLRHSHVR